MLSVGDKIYRRTRPYINDGCATGDDITVFPNFSIIQQFISASSLYLISLRIAILAKGRRGILPVSINS